MDVVHLYCAGLDVHKKTVVACVVTPKPKGGWSKEIRTFTTIMAVAHSILVIAYHIIQRREPYRELGANYFDQQHPKTTPQKLVKRLERMGSQVTLQAQSAASVV